MLVTDRTLCPLERLAEVVADSVAAGVDAVQLREPGLPATEWLPVARDLRRVTAGRALLFINGDVALAHAVGADGLHFGERAAGEACPPGLLVSRAIHSATAAQAAERAGADLLVLGTLYPSRSHPGGQTGGVALVRAVTRVSTLPVLGIGGVTADNAGKVVAAGACGVAVISAILAPENPAAAARRLRAAVDTARTQQEQQSMITVMVNGQTCTLAAPLPLPALIAQLAISHPRIAVALNGTVLRQDEHAGTLVRDGDTLEIVRMVGGG